MTDSDSGKSKPRPRKFPRPSPEDIVRLMLVVSLHERYANMSVITRDASTITYLYRYPSLSSLPVTEDLQNRVNSVQRSIHHLWSEVIDGETNKPKLRLRPEGPWPASQIVRDDTYDASMADNTEEVEAKLLEMEIERMKARVIGRVVPWQVTRYIPSGEYVNSRLSSDTDKTYISGVSTLCGDHPVKSLIDYHTHSSDPHYIAISIYHHIADGIGGLHLSQYLLNPSSSLIPQPSLAPRMEDFISLSLSLPFLIGEAYHELLVPSLPKSLRSALTRQPCWPGENVKGRVTAYPEAQVTIHIPSSWTRALKYEGKAQGVPTLHPILESAYMMAMQEVLGNAECHIEICTPMNVRSSQSQIGGVYTTSLHQSFPPSHLTPAHSNPTHDCLVETCWDLARATSLHHSSKTAKKLAKQKIGSLALIPDPKSFKSPHAENTKRRTKTGWEEFMWSSLDRPAPYRTSVAMSNLGNIGKFPSGCNGMRWSQSANPFEHALLISIAGHEGGIEVTTAFRDGCAAGREEVKKVSKRFKQILERLIQGDGDCEKKLEL